MLILYMSPLHNLSSSLLLLFHIRSTLCCCVVSATDSEPFLSSSFGELEACWSLLDSITTFESSPHSSSSAPFSSWMHPKVVEGRCRASRAGLQLLYYYTTRPARYSVTWLQVLRLFSPSETFLFDLTNQMSPAGGRIRIKWNIWKAVNLGLGYIYKKQTFAFIL